MPDQTPHSDLARFFAFFNEVGILYQLSSTMFGARLPAGFTVSQFSILNHLIRVRDGQTPLALARAFQVPKTTMTHSLSILQRHDLVRIAPNPGDGRSKCVWVTEAGRSFRDQAVSALAPDVEALAAGFPPARLAEAMPVLIAVRQMMDAQRGA